MRLRGAAWVLTGSVVVAPRSLADGDWLPGPATRAPAPEASDAACATCHQAIAAEWRASLHHASATNGYYRRAFAIEPEGYCRGCHAPEASLSTDVSQSAREAGVGCVSCHAAPHGVAGVHAGPGSPQAHAVVGEPRLATPAACVGCHQFDIPNPPGAARVAMQDTVREHAASRAAAVTCQGCHMPLVRDASGMHRGHRFAVQSDPAMLARGVEVRSATLEEGRLILGLEAGATGHAFPTGDMHRAVEVRAHALDAAFAHAPPTSISLGRRFESVPGRAGVTRVERADTRLRPPPVTGHAPREVVLPVPAGARHVRYEVVWQRAPASLATRLGMDAASNEVVVASGEVSR